MNKDKRSRTTPETPPVKIMSETDSGYRLPPPLPSGNGRLPLILAGVAIAIGVIALILALIPRSSSAAIDGTQLRTMVAEAIATLNASAPATADLMLTTTSDMGATQTAEQIKAVTPPTIDVSTATLPVIAPTEAPVIEAPVVTEEPVAQVSPESSDEQPPENQAVDLAPESPTDLPPPINIQFQTESTIFVGDLYGVQLAIGGLEELDAGVITISVNEGTLMLNTTDAPADRCSGASEPSQTWVSGAQIIYCPIYPSQPLTSVVFTVSGSGTVGETRLDQTFAVNVERAPLTFTLAQYETEGQDPPCLPPIADFRVIPFTLTLQSDNGSTGQYRMDVHWETALGRIYEINPEECNNAARTTIEPGMRTFEIGRVYSYQLELDPSTNFSSATLPEFFVSGAVESSAQLRPVVLVLRETDLYAPVGTFDINRNTAGKIDGRTLFTVIGRGMSASNSLWLRTPRGWLPVGDRSDAFRLIGSTDNVPEVQPEPAGS